MSKALGVSLRIILVLVLSSLFCDTLFILSQAVEKRFVTVLVLLLHQEVLLIQQSEYRYNFTKERGIKICKNVLSIMYVCAGPCASNAKGKIVYRYPI